MPRSLFSIKTVNGDLLKGYSWVVDDAVANLIIVTGMEEYLGRYDDFAKFLNNNKINVYGVDHYGQGLNAPKEADLSIVPPSFFSKSVRVINDITKKVKKNGKPIIIFGHSMGSFIVQDYVQRFANNCSEEKIIICGSNGPNAKLLFKLGYFLARVTTSEKSKNQKSKFVASMATGSYAKKIKNHKTNFDWLSYNEENVKKYIDDKLCGYGSSKIFYREFLKGNARLFNKKFIGKINKDSRIFIIAGEDDPVGDFSKGPKALFKLYQDVGVKNVDLKIYKNMRHEILNEKDHQVVYDDILNFINN